MQCANHPDRIAVLTCSACGKGLCMDCFSTIKGETFCRDCEEKKYSISLHMSNADIETTNVPRYIGKKATATATTIMTLLYVGTLCSYFLSWQGGALFISVVVFTLISFVVQVVLLWRNAAKAQWSVGISTLINLVLAIFYTSQSDVPVGFSAIACMMLVLPIALYMALFKRLRYEIFWIAFTCYIIILVVLLMQVVSQF